MKRRPSAPDSARRRNKPPPPGPGRTPKDIQERGGWRWLRLDTPTAVRLQVAALLVPPHPIGPAELVRRIAATLAAHPELLNEIAACEAATK